ncbi:MAG: AMP-binding protein, partial [Thermoplasmatales archaeon]
MSEEDISVLLDEKRIFNPKEELVNQTNVKLWMEKYDIKKVDELYKKAENWEWFWEEVSKDLVEWYEPFNKIIEWNPPYAKWFVGAKYNIVHDALDKHVKSWRKNKVAFIFEGEPGDVQKITYNDLYVEVNKFACALKKLGIKKGDRIGIYLPMILELPIAMLACAKIGAIHSVVFSGFSASAFRDRVNDCEAKVVITCDGFWRRGGKVYLKQQADEALEDAPSVKHCIVVKRTGDGV